LQSGIDGSTRPFDRNAVEHRTARTRRITPPPPVVVAETGKPATTVLMTVEWTTDIGPELALAESGKAGTAGSTT